MAFKMKNINDVLNLHPTSNHLDNVIVEHNMPKGVWGWIDQAKTIHVNKNISKKSKAKTIAHEKGHKKQMELGENYVPKLEFNSLNYKWTPEVGGPTHIIPTDSFDTRNRKLPWERAMFRRKHYRHHVEEKRKTEFKWPGPYKNL